MKCLRCNYVGHVEKYCHNIRCYMCKGFGHKAKKCLKKVRQPKISVSYVTDKEKEICPIQIQREFAHIKKWVKKMSQVNIVEELSI